MHPYTRAPLSAVPIPDPAAEARRGKERIVLEGEPPDAVHPPAGCRFSGRCPMSAEVQRSYGIDCAVTAPILAEAKAATSSPVICTYPVGHSEAAWPGSR
jgi:oligopeptide/dipeptide ABC transporter ATP-binding protein